MLKTNLVFGVIMDKQSGATESTLNFNEDLITAGVQPLLTPSHHVAHQ